MKKNPKHRKQNKHKKTHKDAILLVIEAEKREANMPKICVLHNFKRI